MRSNISEKQKLTVECRIEAGCLGPAGKDFVDGFCEFAKAEFAKFENDFVDWVVVPRQNSSQSEVQYKVAGKTLSEQQASRYLELFGKKIADFEAEIDDQLILLIEQYMA